MKTCPVANATLYTASAHTPMMRGTWKGALVHAGATPAMHAPAARLLITIPHITRQRTQIHAYAFAQAHMLENIEVGAGIRQ